MKPPCKDCQGRHETCHADCQRYAEYWAACEKTRAQRAEISRALEVDHRAYERVMRRTAWKKR